MTTPSARLVASYSANVKLVPSAYGTPKFLSFANLVVWIPPAVPVAHLQCSHSLSWFSTVPCPTETSNNSGMMRFVRLLIVLCTRALRDPVSGAWVLSSASLTVLSNVRCVCGAPRSGGTRSCPLLLVAILSTLKLMFAKSPCLVWYSVDLIALPVISSQTF